jgi:uncharacterized protein
MRRSQYLMMGSQVYTDAAGRRVKIAYSARKAKFVVLGAGTAQKLTEDRIGEIAPAELHRLVTLNAIVPDAADELSGVLGGLRAGSADPARRGFSILATSYCNMACDYCGQEHYKAAVNQDLFDTMASRVEAAIRDPACRTVEVSWFGGEPMLAFRVIREMSARFISAAEANDVRYGAKIVTNGSLLTASKLSALHDECKVRSMEVTLDGPEKVHDQRRLKRNGIGSFHRTVAVLGRAVRDQLVPDMTIVIRVNVDDRNEAHVAGLLYDLACLGLATRQVQLQLMPVHSWGNDVTSIELEARRFAELESEWLHLAQWLGIGFTSLPGAVRQTTCKATSIRREIFDTAGRVYSCSEHPLVPGARDTGVIATVGDLVGSAGRPRGQYDGWYDEIESGAQQCARCPLLPVCGGSCPKSWHEGNLPCPSMKFNWKTRMDIEARRRGYLPVASLSAAVLFTLLDMAQRSHGLT